MITHVVLFKLLPGFTADSAPVQAFHAAMLELPGKIPLIKSWSCGFNTVPDAQAAHYVLVAGFESQADLFAYFEHPAHVAAVCCLDGAAELLFGDIAA
ncbi:Dabb family protein [Uliginosibacterium sp. 31-12]|uniref:Dabb family protein n=1 Tax=Uliginosibacterium sp. 31-12 TaxID=3062781 RepID=UPI0026E423FA|nr:Dabb family protein [Uliginosibacterium sp. 31-12]MDO6384968.1 Dabb family protein [Uliginosibacterium sp. 31-12]